MVADLAESWDVSDNGRVYTFRIRPDATFHDGKPVTAEDVRWSLERATDPLTESPNVDQYLGDIVGVEAKIAGEDRKSTRLNSSHKPISYAVFCLKKKIKRKEKGFLQRLQSNHA